MPPPSRLARICTSTLSQEITKSGEGSFEGGYTVDGVAFFDTMAAMKSSIEEDKVKAELTTASEPITREQVLNITANRRFQIGFFGRLLP